MNINTGQFNDSYFPIMDGVGMTTHNYAHWLNTKYGRSVVVAPKVKGYEDLVNYKVHRFKSVLLPGMNPYRVGLPLLDIKFKKKLKRENFDLIHAHCPFISGQFALKIARKLNIPLVTTFHTKYREDFKKVIPNEGFVDFLVNFTLDFYNSADLVLVPNKSTGETLREYGYQGNFEIMPNGTDMQIPEKTMMLQERKNGLEMVGAHGDEFIMLFVGQHRWEKNVRMILDSLKTLHNQGASFKMVFVGEGYASAEMKQFVLQNYMQDKVIFLGVLTDRTLLQQIYATADLFVFPSVYDNSPLVIQEAAAYSVPSVVVKGTSAAENIEDGVNGFTIENQVEYLTKKISALIINPQAVMKAGTGARKTLHHPWEQIVDDVYTRYVALIREKQPAEHRQWEDEDDSDHDRLII
jgi:glycosyltransferase involved in cell wall biosynthesis